MNNTSIASAMLCKRPRSFDNRLVLSCYDGVWEPVAEIPIELRQFFTDELGNINPEYGGFLQIVNVEVLQLLGKYDLYMCFRAVLTAMLNEVDVMPGDYRAISLKCAGWDVATTNGWRSASSSGVFPVDPFSGEVLNVKDYASLNENCLFSTMDGCLKCVEENNETVTTFGAWIPVAVLLDTHSAERLSVIRQLSKENS